MAYKKVKIKPFKDWKGKTRYEVVSGMRFLGGGFATKKSAQKHKVWVEKHKGQLGLE